MKRDVQVAHSHSSQERGEQVADAMPNNKTGTPNLVVMHFYSPSFASECFKKEQGIKEPVDKAEKNNDS